MANPEITTMPEIVDLVPSQVELQQYDSAELRRQLQEAIGLTETAIRRVAALWAELTRRGENLTDIRFALAEFLPAVARGDLLPRLVVAFAGQPRALQRLGDLPVAKQAALVEGEQIEIWNATRGTERRKISDLHWGQIATIVQGGRILTADEQRAAAERRPVRIPKSHTVDIRLARPDYLAAAEAAKSAGVTVEHYLRQLIRAALSGGQGA